MTRLQTEKQTGKRGKSSRVNGALSDPDQQLRLVEALLFASAEPLEEAALAERLPGGADVKALLAELAETYAHRGVRLAKVGKGWAFRTAADLSPYLRLETKVARNLSPAMTETLAIIAYHQPVTRAEIEEIRGKTLSRGTLDLLLQAGWVKPRGHRRSPGRPMTWGTSDAFLDHFGLESLDALPGLDDLKAAGLLDARPAITAYGAIGKAAGDQLPEPANNSETEAAESLLEPLDADDGGGAKAGR
jgi:segregation and condensation protein B